MKVNHYQQVEQVPVDMEGSSGCKVRWLLDETHGTPNFAMRQYEVSPGGYTPRHSHPYEHEVFVLEGEGVVFEGDLQHPLAAGDVVLITPDELHQFRNTGTAPLKFLCLVPNSATNRKAAVAAECSRSVK